MQVAYDYRHLANRSAKCKSLSAIWRTSPTTCGKLSYPYKHLLQLAGDLRTPTNISCNLRETFVPLQTSPAICGRLSYPYIPSPAICGRLSYPYIPSPATCGRLSYPYIPSPATCGRPSYPYKHLLQLAGDLRTPTKKCFSFFFAYDLCFLSKALLLFH